MHQPTSVEQAQEIVKQSAKVKALGTRHSFNDIADTDGDLISTENLNCILSLDAQAKTVTIESGVRYGELCQFLNERGLALHNLASLPHISVAGACATGTHGSGIGVGNLSTAVRALTLMTASGDLLRLSREDKRFAGAVVGLGALGIVTDLTLNVEPTYEMEQRVYLDLPFPALKEHFEAIETSGYSVSLFTDWRAERFNQIWVKRRTSPSNPDAPKDLFGAWAATEKMHPLAGLSAVHCTEQLGVPGPWFERLPHFKLGFTPSSGEELQSEFLVAQNDVLAALEAVRTLAHKISPVLFVCEVRTIAKDELWLSPSYGRDSVAIHFTWQQRWPEVKALLPEIEAVLAPFGARPHWGKLFSMGGEKIETLYEKLPEFRRLVANLNPEGKFWNGFLEAKIG